VAGRGWEPRVDGRVRWLGEVSEEMKWALITASDLVVVPSWYEPFGLTALEAAAAGKPVVISDRVGAGEVLQSAPRFRAGDPRSLADTLIDLLNTGRAGLEDVGGRLRGEALSRTWRDVAEDLYRS
jgi:glycosyltransferase involved in cell wall biosynthesis